MIGCFSAVSGLFLSKKGGDSMPCHLILKVIELIYYFKIYIWKRKTENSPNKSCDTLYLILYTESQFWLQCFTHACFDCNQSTDLITSVIY